MEPARPPWPGFNRSLTLQLTARFGYGSPAPAALALAKLSAPAPAPALLFVPPLHPDRPVMPAAPAHGGGSDPAYPYGPSHYHPSVIVLPSPPPPPPNSKPLTTTASPALCRSPHSCSSPSPHSLYGDLPLTQIRISCGDSAIESSIPFPTGRALRLMYSASKQWPALVAAAASDPTDRGDQPTEEEAQERHRGKHHFLDLVLHPRAADSRAPILP